MNSDSTEYWDSKKRVSLSYGLVYKSLRFFIEVIISSSQGSGDSTRSFKSLPGKENLDMSGEDVNSLLGDSLNGLILEWHDDVEICELDKLF